MMLTGWRKWRWWLAGLLIISGIASLLWLLATATGPQPQRLVFAPERTEPGTHFIFPLIFISPQQVPKSADVRPTPLPALRKMTGVAWPHEDVMDRVQDLAAIGAQVTLDWGMDPDKAGHLQEAGIAYLPMQWSCRTGAQSVNVARVQVFAREHPGATWLAFNEPDHAGQANCTPARGAAAYRALVDAVRAADPTARVYCCGTAWPNGHIAWTQAFGEAYRALYGVWPAVDGFHFHNYSLAWEDRFDVAMRIREIEAARAWQQQTPWLRNKPVIISEWGLLSGSWWREDAGRIAQAYLPQMRAWFARQPWIVADVWFASFYSTGMYAPSNIWSGGSHTLTDVGAAWRRTR